MIKSVVCLELTTLFACDFSLWKTLNILIFRDKQKGKEFMLKSATKVLIMLMAVENVMRMPGNILSKDSINDWRLPEGATPLAARSDNGLLNF